MATFALSLAALVLTALLLSVHAFGLAALNPVMRAMDATVYIPTKQAMDLAAPKLARPLMLAALLVTGVAVISAAIASDASALVFDAVALIGLMVTLVAILRGDLPINQAMSSWSATQPPDDWETVRARWERFFAIRCAANTLALLGSGAAVVTSAMALG